MATAATAKPAVLAAKTKMKTAPTVKKLKTPSKAPAVQIAEEISISPETHIAWTARSKLSHEAQQRDHKLRQLVGHANLLDKLVVELAEERRKDGGRRG